jgi:hypothetical protein
MPECPRWVQLFMKVWTPLLCHMLSLTCTP